MMRAGRDARQDTRDECALRNVCRRVFLALFAAVYGFFVLNGCKGFEIRTQSNTLSESGFLARVPETTRQRDAYAALPPYRLYRGVVGGNAFYAYKNEKDGVVYLGNEQDYQRYMQKVRWLASHYETTETKMTAYDMENEVQSRWYGSWDNLGSSTPAY
jgi:hypothetical protein